MDQISNYIVQAKAAKEPTVTMRVNHDELGMIDITVNKSMTPGMVKREDCAEKQIVAYTKELTRWIVDKQRVCPVGALSLEWHLVEPSLQIEIKKLHEFQKEWLTRMYKEIQKEEGLRLSVNDAVLTTMGLIQGSIQLARINEDSSMVEKNLKSYLKCIKE
jgi:hypothetical protein